MSENANFLMPESEGPVVCYALSHPIAAAGYEQNFLPMARSLIEKYGEIRILLNYLSYQGWEEEAAQLDLGAHMDLGRYLTKLCLVNAPEKEIMARLMRNSLTRAELRFFPAERLSDAIAWIKE